MLKKSIFTAISFLSIAYSSPTTAEMQTTIEDFIEYVGDLGSLENAKTNLNQNPTGKAAESKNPEQVAINNFFPKDGTSGIEILEKDIEGRISITGASDPEKIGTYVSEGFEDGVFTKEINGKKVTFVSFNRERIEQKLKDSKKVTNLPPELVCIRISKEKTE